MPWSAWSTTLGEMVDRVLEQQPASVRDERPDDHRHNAAVPGPQIGTLRTAARSDVVEHDADQDDEGGQDEEPLEQSHQQPDGKADHHHGGPSSTRDHVGADDECSRRHGAAVVGDGRGGVDLDRAE